jgi:hypothetical protein
VEACCNMLGNQAYLVESFRLGIVLKSKRQHVGCRVHLDGIIS